MRQRLFQPVLLAALAGVTLGTGPIAAWANASPGGGAGQRVTLGQIAQAGHAGHIEQMALAGHGLHAMQEIRTAPAGQATAATDGLTPLLGNLGSHRHPITISSELGQQYFDEGLILTFGFNHAEAIRSFRDAIMLDPACAMCYWGIALALGPNINAPMEPSAVPEALAALGKARDLAPSASPVEQAYIEALGARYSPDPDADRAAPDLAYANAMRTLAARYPDDLDAATLFAEALMDLSPWQYWTRDGQPTEYTGDIVATLESVLARDPEHPGANHYYIHATEASRMPERAIPSAQRLEQLVPGAGHLTHMPAHTYWRVGRYHDAARVNEQAILVDEAALRRGVRGADQGTHSFYFLAYYPHNVHFLFAAAHMGGRSELALTAARKLVAVIPEGAYQEVPALEDYRPMPLFAMVRFGKWAEIIAEPQPAEQLKYTTGIWHWARGLAYLRQGSLDEADREYGQLVAIAKSDAMDELTLASFPKAATLLEIASNVLAAELANSRGRTDEAVSKLEAAAGIQDELAYIEPPAWFYPVRHNLGAVLLEAGRAVEAEAVYREDLRQYPNNGWSLLGLAKSLRAQGKPAEAAEAEQRLAEAWQHADVKPDASRF
jgi:tetratricopeptide (TPR) repeat protein